MSNFRFQVGINKMSQLSRRRTNFLQTFNFLAFLVYYRTLKMIDKIGNYIILLNLFYPTVEAK